MSEVSYCCGSSYYEESFITNCCSVEIRYDCDKDNRICPSCKEHTECTGYICSQCGNWFEELEEQMEHEERMKENAILDRWEADRDEGI